MSNPLIVALDVPTPEQARELVDDIGDAAGAYKIGLELYLAHVRAVCPRPFMIVTPGIRPAGSANDDQARAASPAEAIAAGADRIVIGRPITRAQDPRAAAQAIIQGLQ